MGYKSGYAKARRKEDEQYRLWMGDYAASKDRFGENVTEAEALRQRTLADYDKLSDQDKVDFQRSQEASMAAQYQALAARGLSDSSIANNAYAGNSRETAYGLNRIADERQRGRIGYDVGLTADLINLKQAGPTSPSTAMYQATVQNLQASMQFYQQQQARDDARKGLNQSWTRGYSQYTSPGRIFPLVSQLSGAAAGAALGGGMGAAMGANMDQSQGGTNTGQGGGGYQYGSVTQGMTQPAAQPAYQPSYGQGGTSVFQSQQQAPRYSTPNYSTNYPQYV
jgi:hypothetical protein